MFGPCLVTTLSAPAAFRVQKGLQWRLPRKLALTAFLWQKVGAFLNRVDPIDRQKKTSPPKKAPELTSRFTTQQTSSQTFGNKRGHNGGSKGRLGCQRLVAYATRIRILFSSCHAHVKNVGFRSLTPPFILLEAKLSKQKNNDAANEDAAAKRQAKKAAKSKRIAKHKQDRKLQDKAAKAASHPNKVAKRQARLLALAEKLETDAKTLLAQAQEARAKYAKMAEEAVVRDYSLNPIML